MSKATFSRDSSSYTATRHAMQRLKDTSREVDPWMVNRTIEEGNVNDAWRSEKGDIKVKLHEKIHSMLIEVIILAETHEVVTAINKSD